MIFACVLFKVNDLVPHYGKYYNPGYVEKLYRGVKRNFPQPFRFVCLTDQTYLFREPIESIRLTDPHHDWQSLMEMFKLQGRVLAMGLDTVITGDLTEIMTYEGPLALCQDPYDSGIPCNGVMLFNNGPAIYQQFLDTPDRRIMYRFGGVPSELAWLRAFYRKSDLVDKLFPGQVVSWKWHIRRGNYDEKKVRIVFFHGHPKPHEIDGLNDCPEFVKSAWC